jgi:hypothetical protein
VWRGFFEFDRKAIALTRLLALRHGHGQSSRYLNLKRAHVVALVPALVLILAPEARRICCAISSLVSNVVFSFQWVGSHARRQ